MVYLEIVPGGLDRLPTGALHQDESLVEDIRSVGEEDRSLGGIGVDGIDHLDQLHQLQSAIRMEEAGPGMEPCREEGAEGDHLRDGEGEVGSEVEFPGSRHQSFKSDRTFYLLDFLGGVEEVKFEGFPFRSSIGNTIHTLNQSK